MAKKSGLIDKTEYFKISKKLKYKAEFVHNYAIKSLSYIGERAVKFAREDHTNNWGDRTGNLRSSIGYMVLCNGKPVAFGKSQIYKKGHGGDTAKEQLLNKLKAEFPNGYAVVVVAGMNYAAYVEAVHGKDVISGAELLAQSLAKKLLTKLTDAQNAD